MNDTMETLMARVLASQEAMAHRQESQASDINVIKDSMVQMVLIEERQTNQSAAIQRMSNQVERVAARTHEQDIKLADLTGESNRLTTKVSLIAGSIATVVTGSIIVVFQFILRNSSL